MLLHKESMIIFWAFLVIVSLMIIIVDSKLVIQENEWGKITREQIVAEAELIAEFEEEDDCKYRKRLRKEYAVTIITENGEEEIETVDIMDIIMPQRTIPYQSINLTTYPGLNCLEQEDPDLVKALRNDILYPPASSEISRIVPTLKKYAEYHQDEFLDKIIFKESVKNGFFIESGADDFVTTSNTLYFEEKHNWTGILLEPNPNRFMKGLAVHRRSWSAPICLSTITRPDFFQFKADDKAGFMAMSRGKQTERQSQLMEHALTLKKMDSCSDEISELNKFQCFPLFSVLLALDSPTVTLLSLDIEGAEFEVFRSLPWDKVDIEVIVTELVHAGELFPGSRLEVIKFLESKNYQYIGNLYDDIFVRKDLLGVKYQIDIQKAEQMFEQFSSEVLIEREDILEKCLGRSDWLNEVVFEE